MTKTYEPRWGYNASGAFSNFPLNADWFKEIPILNAYDETSTEKDFEERLTPILKKTPFWVDRSDLINRLKSARKISGKDGFFDNEESHFIKLKRFKKELASIAENEYEKKFELLEKELGADLSPAVRDELNEVASKFLINRATIDKPVTLNQSKAACKILSDVLPLAICALQGIDKTTKERLCNTSQKACCFYLDSDFFIDGLNLVKKAAEKLIVQKPTDKKLARHSLWFFISELIPVYERVTNNKAGATNSEYSSFVLFVIKCFSYTLGKEIPEKIEKKDNSKKYSEHTINRMAVDIIAYRKEKVRLENSLKNRIPLTETQEGMLKAYQKAKKEIKQEGIKFIKDLKKK